MRPGNYDDYEHFELRESGDSSNSSETSEERKMTSLQRMFDYIPFNSVLKVSKAKPTTTIQNAYTLTKGIATNCATTATTARITEIHQKFFVGALSFMASSLVMNGMNVEVKTQHFTLLRRESQARFTTRHACDVLQREIRRVSVREQKTF
jgi:hypothetical protein